MESNQGQPSPIPTLNISIINESPDATTVEAVEINNTTSKEPIVKKKKLKATPKKVKTSVKKIVAKTPKSKLTKKTTINSPKMNGSFSKLNQSSSTKSSPRKKINDSFSTNSPPSSPKSNKSPAKNQSSRRSSIQNYSPRSRSSLQLEEFNDRRILKTPTKRQWSSPSSSFASQSPRFVEERPSTPPSTKYNPQFEINSSRQSLSSPFLSTSPRFIEPRSQSPSHFDYEPNYQEKILDLASVSLRSSTPRFSNSTTDVPPIGTYETNTSNQSNSRPMSPFKSSTPRFIEQKRNTNDIGSVVISSFEVKAPESPSSIFKSNSNRFPDPQTNSPSPISGLTISSFKPQSPTKSPFGSTTERFKIYSFPIPSSADYSSQEISDFIYSPRK